MEANMADTTKSTNAQLPLRKKLLFVAVILATLAIVLELGLRTRQLALYGTWGVPGWLQIGHKKAGRWHPFLRTVPAPGSFKAIERGESAMIEINALGFRSPDFAFTKPPKTCRIVCVGGSVVYDTRVTLAESWPMQLQSRLQRHAGSPKVEVINAGIPGRTSADSVVNVSLRVLPLNPDLVIVLHGVNDQKPNRYPGFKHDYSHWYVPPMPPHQLILHKIANRSLLASHVRNRSRLLLNPDWHENWRGEDLERFDSVAPEGLMAYRRNIESIIAMCRMQGVEVLLATAANSLHENGDWTPALGTRNPLVFYHENLTESGILQAFHAYNTQMREAASAHQCVLVDLDADLPTGATIFQDDVHFTPTGSRTVAEQFATAIIEELPHVISAAGRQVVEDDVQIDEADAGE
jgi:lysophospholipase L1-like esterase